MIVYQFEIKNVCMGQIRSHTTEYATEKRGYILMNGKEKRLANLKPINLATRPEDERKEIARMGAQASNKVKAEKRTAKQALDKILAIKLTEDIIAGAELPPELAEQLRQNMPNVTMYDLIQLVAVGLATSGNMRAVEYIRDTYGDMPRKEVSIATDIMTDADRALLETINDRLNNSNIVIAHDITESDN